MSDSDWLAECACIMGFTTLESRNSDRLDFREVGVEAAKRALEAAYEAGRAVYVDQGGPSKWTHVDTYEYVGFTYFILRDGENWRAEPALGQHAAANKQKHKLAAILCWRQDARKGRQLA